MSFTACGVCCHPAALQAFLENGLRDGCLQSRVLSSSSSQHGSAKDEESLYYAADIPLSLMGFFMLFYIFQQKLYLKNNIFPSKQPNIILLLPFLPPLYTIGDRCSIRLPWQQQQQQRLIRCLSAPSVVWQTNCQSQRTQRRHVVRSIDRQALRGKRFPCLLNGGGATWLPVVVVIIWPKAQHFQTIASPVTALWINVEYIFLYKFAIYV